MPRLRAMSMSGLVSELKDTMPCTSPGADAGFLQRQVDRLDGEAQFRSSRRLGELGGPDAGDGHLATERMGWHQAWPPSGRTRRQHHLTVPVT